MDAQTRWTSLSNCGAALIHAGAELDDDGRFLEPSVSAAIGRTGWSAGEVEAALSRLHRLGLIV